MYQILKTINDAAMAIPLIGLTAGVLLYAIYFKSIFTSKSQAK